MLDFSGVPVSGGIILKKCIYQEFSREEPEERKAGLPLEEICRLQKAMLKSREGYEELVRMASEKGFEKEKALFESYLTVLQDPELIRLASTILESSPKPLTCEEVLMVMLDYLKELFTSQEDRHFRSLYEDFQALSLTVERNLREQQFVASFEEIEDDVILVSRNLSPEEVFLLGREKASGLVLQEGSEAGHTAVIARARKLPMVLSAGSGLKEAAEAGWCLLDANAGSVYFGTYEELAPLYRELKVSEESPQDPGSFHLETTIPVRLLANIIDPSEADLAAISGAEGIGLFRTEFLLPAMGRRIDEERQIRAYRYVLEVMDGKEVVFRTFDLGADKAFDGNFDDPDRGLQRSLRERTMFIEQIRALLKASAGRTLNLMFPAVESLRDFLEAKDILLGIQRELSDKGFSIPKEVHVGSMIETSGAVREAEKLSKAADFFSIGTNDLFREYDGDRHAVERALSIVSEIALRACIPVCICGDVCLQESWESQLLSLKLSAWSADITELPSLRRRLSQRIQEEKHGRNG